MHPQANTEPVTLGTLLQQARERAGTAPSGVAIPRPTSVPPPSPGDPGTGLNIQEGAQEAQFRDAREAEAAERAARPDVAVPTQTTVPPPVKPETNPFALVSQASMAMAQGNQEVAFLIKQVAPTIGHPGHFIQGVLPPPTGAELDPNTILGSVAVAIRETIASGDLTRPLTREELESPLALPMAIPQGIPLTGGLTALSRIQGRFTARLSQAGRIGDLLPNESAFPGRSAPVIDIPGGAGTSILPNLQAVDEVLEIAQAERLPELFSKIPGVSQAIRLVDASKVAWKPIDVAFDVILPRLKAQGGTRATIAMAHLRRLGTIDELFGPEDAQGYLTRGPLKGKVLNDVRTYPGRYELTEAQREWIRTAHVLEDAKLKLLNDNGVEVVALTFDEGGQFAGRKIYSRTLADGQTVEGAFVGPGPARFGGRLGLENQRVFETAEDAIAAGYKLMREDDALWLNLRGAYNRVGQKQVDDWLRDRIPWRTTGAPEELRMAALAAKAKTVVARNAIKAIQRARRGERLPSATIKSIERVLPTVGSRLSTASRITLEDMVRAVEALQAPAVELPVPTAGTLQKLSRLLEDAVTFARANPKNAEAQRNARTLARQLGFAKFRFAKGEPFLLEKKPIKELRLLQDKALQELLTEVRGVPEIGVTATGKPITRFKGGLLKELQVAETKVKGDLAKAAARARKPAPFGRESGLSPERIAELVRRGELSKLGAPVGAERQVISPAFAGRILAHADAEAIDKALGTGMTGFSQFLTAINNVNAVQRLYALAGDASPFTIQLIFLAGQPVKMARAAKGFTQAFFDPAFQSKYITRNADLIARHHNFFLASSGTTEAVEALTRGGLLTRGPGKIPEKLLQPFRRGYETALDVAGIEMLKSLEAIPKNAVERAQMVSFVNEFRGLVDTARLGVPQTMRQLESVALLAPKYNRAIASLLFDVFRGNLRGHLARVALLRGVAALSAMNVAVSLARGESPDEIWEHFIPGNPNFFTWTIAGQQIGPGSKVRSVLNLIGNSAEDPSRLLELSMDNPGLRFVRGNMAAAPSATTDLLTGRRFNGDPSRDGMLSVAETVLAENLLPIWIQSMALEGGTIPQRATRGAAEFFGFRAYPSPAIVDFIDYVEKQTGGRYENLDKVVKDRFKKVDPVGKQKYERHLADLEGKGRVEEAILDLRAARDQRIERLDIVSEYAEANDAFPLLRVAIQESGQELAAQYEAIEGVPRYADTFERFEEIPDNATPDDLVYRKYMAIITDPTLDDEIEGYDFDERDRRLDDLRNLYPLQWGQVLEIRDLDRSAYSQAVRAWYRASEVTLKPFWDITDDVIGDNGRLREQYKEYVQLGKEDRQRQRDFARIHVFLGAAVAEIAKRRKAMRLTNRAVDATLSKWYAQYKPLNPLNQ